MENEVRLIDANALDALEDLKYIYHPVFDGNAWYRVEDVWKCIDEQPTIDPESLRPKGRWLLDGRCSECLENPLTTHKTYCPHCGAKMER